MPELAGLGGVSAMMNRHSLAVTQQNHVPVLAKHGVQPIDLVLSLNQDILQRLAKHLQLVLGNDVGRRKIRGVHAIVEEASAPGLEYLVWFGEQIRAVDVQLDAVAVREALRSSIEDALNSGGHREIRNEPDRIKCYVGYTPELTSHRHHGFEVMVILRLSGYHATALRD
jgi:hypothetical protein